MLNDRKAVQAWHEQIQQDDIGSLVGDRLQGLLAIRRGHHLIRLALEELAHQVDDLWVIVDHQEAARCGGIRVSAARMASRSKGLSR